mmetsp:Transcript_14158/g.20914  ORF Transcript_14158/g.20914 Transcript_14158/m.20914 type:complete len:201 (-) Transcript_14158:551-1153(-)|eukprot:CAMPEP_0194222384 /NCGR_PEP_ID=MMETSP0156-20130528/32824_1 /TAXON_ID=33649 /ORGANISM="Thalassionema nitzschioides, Strain L26-B" /LENGTH=200 /DNA_ID=CAMNT_0038953151 /DNA_START=46 /DNA_END=648 /DNA_ORIENTATION=-
MTEQQPVFRNSNEAVLQVNGDTNEPLAPPHNSVSRRLMRGENLWHRASYVFVETIDGKFVVQQRTASKEYCPNYFAPATGGVMAPDETNELNAQRELAEEIGVERSLEEMVLLDQFRYQDDKTSVWGNVFYVKLVKGDPPLTLQKEEVASVEFWDKEMMEKLISLQEDRGVENVDKKITPDGIVAFRVLLQGISKQVPDK